MTFILSLFNILTINIIKIIQYVVNMLTNSPICNLVMLMYTSIVSVYSIKIPSSQVDPE